MPRTANEVKKTLKHFKDLLDGVTKVDLESSALDNLEFLVSKKTNTIDSWVDGSCENFKMNKNKFENYLFKSTSISFQNDERAFFAILPRLWSEVIGRNKSISLKCPEFRCEMINEAFSLFNREFFFQKPLSQTNVASLLPLLYKNSLTAENFRITVIFAILLTIYQTLIEALGEMNEGNVSFENNIILNPAARIQFQISNNPYPGKAVDPDTQLIMGLLELLQHWHVCSAHLFDKAPVFKEAKGLTYFDMEIEVLERENYLSGVQESYSSFVSSFFKRVTTGRPGKEIDIQHLFILSQEFRQAFAHLDKISGREKGGDLPNFKEVGIEATHKEAFFIFTSAKGIEKFFNTFFNQITCPAHIYVLNYLKKITAEESKEVEKNAYLNNQNGVNCVETSKRADKRNVGRDKYHQISKILFPEMNDMPSVMASLVWIGEQLLELNKIESIDDNYQLPVLVSLDKGHSYLLGCAISLYVQKSEVELLSDIQKKQDITPQEAQLYRLVLQMHAFKHINLLGNYFQTLKPKPAEDLFEFSKYDYASFANRRALHEKILSLRGSSSNPTMDVSTLRLIQVWVKTLVLSNLFEPSVPEVLTKKILEESDVSSYASSFKDLLSILNEYIAFLGEKIALSTPEESAKEEWRNEVLYQQILKYGKVDSWLDVSFNCDDISFVAEEDISRNLRQILTLLITIRNEIKPKELDLFSNEIKENNNIINNNIIDNSHREESSGYILN